MLFGFWYPATLSSDLPRRKLTATMLLGLPLVLGRDAQERPFALRDACPHRAMPLSFGRFDGQTVECIYHGWKFDCHSGECRAIPSLTADANVKIERIFAAAFPCVERDGYVWVYFPDSEATPAAASPAGSPPELPPALPTFSERYRTFHYSVEFPSDVDQGVLGLIDPAHGPYVHQSWFWRSQHTQRDKEKTFEPIPHGFRMKPHAPSANSAAYKLLGVYGQPVTTTIDFELPAMRTEMIRLGKYWFTDRTIMTPISHDRCRLDFTAAWNLFPWMPFVPSIFGCFARRFIAQDQSNFEKQALGLRHNSKMMLVGDADRQARWYYQLKAAYREAQRTGAPLQHPLSGPVTLRWRS
jgi:phenylpropionate dioxygenase-like ring-hydroxylating dioxygenase large terminal subunit